MTMVHRIRHSWETKEILLHRRRVQMTNQGSHRRCREKILPQHHRSWAVAFRRARRMIRVLHHYPWVQTPLIRLRHHQTTAHYQTTNPELHHFLEHFWSSAAAVVVAVVVVRFFRIATTK